VKYMWHKRCHHICDNAMNFFLKNGTCKKRKKYRLTCLRSKSENCTRQYRLSQVEEKESGYNKRMNKKEKKNRDKPSIDI
jgi:hypothetical protein